MTRVDRRGFLAGTTAAVLAGPAAVRPAAGQASSLPQGVWSQVQPWPTVAIHQTLLPNNKILSWNYEGGGNNVGEFVGVRRRRSALCGSVDHLGGSPQHDHEPVLLRPCVSSRRAAAGGRRPQWRSLCRPGRRQHLRQQRRLSLAQPEHPDERRALVRQRDHPAERGRPGAQRVDDAQERPAPAAPGLHGRDRHLAEPDRRPGGHGQLPEDLRHAGRARGQHRPGADHDVPRHLRHGLLDPGPDPSGHGEPGLRHLGELRARQVSGGRRGDRGRWRQHRRDPGPERRRRRPGSGPTR